MAFSPDGRQLASASNDDTVRLWNARDPATISQLKLGAALAAVAWGPRGITVAAKTGLVQRTRQNLAILQATQYKDRYRAGIVESPRALSL